MGRDYESALNIDRSKTSFTIGELTIKLAHDYMVAVKVMLDDIASTYDREATNVTE